MQRRIVEVELDREDLLRDLARNAENSEIVIRGVHLQRFVKRRA